MSIAALFTLAQDAAGAPAAAATGPPWWQIVLQSAFGLTIVFIFLTAIVTVLIQQRKKDKCLKLMHDYHVSYITTTGAVTWGDLIVYSKGLELAFDAPYRTQRGLFKTSALIYEDELANGLAICRSIDALTDRERRKRKHQIRRSFRPSPIRRTGRWFRNLVNTLKDAFSKALSALIGQLSKARTGAVLTTHKGGVDQIGQTLLGAAANAYEPLLEQHIGKPVVVQLASPADPEKKLVDLPGYLVDYTDKYLAVFNVEHEPISNEKIEVTESVAQPGYKIDITDQSLTVACQGPEILIVKSIETAKRYARLEVALTNGARLELNRGGSEPVTLHLERTRRVDLVCPRAQATIYFGGELPDPSRAKEHGMAPEPAVERAGD